MKLRKLVCSVRNFKVYHRWVPCKMISKIGIYQVNDSENDDIFVIINKKRIDNFGDICDAIYRYENDYHKKWIRDNKIKEILL